MGSGRLVDWEWLVGKPRTLFILHLVFPSLRLYPGPGIKFKFSLHTNHNQTLILPTIFAALAEKTFYIFGACNGLSIIMVYCLYPETNQRTLEEMDLVFASDSIWTWEAEKNYKLLSEQNPHLVQAARRGQSVVDPETGMKSRSGRQFSLDPREADGNAGSKEEEARKTGMVERL